MTSVLEEEVNFGDHGLEMRDKGQEEHLWGMKSQMHYPNTIKQEE